MGDVERLAWKEVWLYAVDCSALLRSLSDQRRRAVSRALIEDLLSIQGGMCPLCSQAIEQTTLGAFHVDHIIPFAYGGGYERTNLQIVHPVCNQRKGDSVDVRDLVPYLERKATEIA